MIWYPSHLSKSVFAHFWIGLLCSLPRGEMLLRAICFAHIKAQNKPTANWNTKHKPSWFPWLFWSALEQSERCWFRDCLDHVPVVKHCHWLCPWCRSHSETCTLCCFFCLACLDWFLWEMFNVSLLPFVWLGKLWNHPSLGISIRTNSSIYDT